MKNKLLIACAVLALSLFGCTVKKRLVYLPEQVGGVNYQTPTQEEKLPCLLDSQTTQKYLEKKCQKWFLNPQFKIHKMFLIDNGVTADKPNILWVGYRYDTETFYMTDLWGKSFQVTDAAIPNRSIKRSFRIDGDEYRIFVRHDKIIIVPPRDKRYPTTTKTLPK